MNSDVLKTNAESVSPNKAMRYLAGIAGNMENLFLFLNSCLS